MNALAVRDVPVRHVDALLARDFADDPHGT